MFVTERHPEPSNRERVYGTSSRATGMLWLVSQPRQIHVDLSMRARMLWLPKVCVPACFGGRKSRWSTRVCGNSEFCIMRPVMLAVLVHAACCSCLAFAPAMGVMHRTHGSVYLPSTTQSLCSRGGSQKCLLNLQVCFKFCVWCLSLARARSLALTLAPSLSLSLSLSRTLVCLLVILFLYLSVNNA
jgi:hypothetical protein